MAFFDSIFSTIMEALFPLSPIEKAVLSLSPEKALEILPSSPPLPIADARAIFAYKDERVAKLIWSIKYKKSPLALKIAGYALYQKLKKLVGGAPDRQILLIPVPMTARRRRERGYNQCELLVDELSKLIKEEKFAIEKNLLFRSHHTSRQTLKNRAERLKSASGLFSIDKDRAVIYHDHRIVVIDDVITTGSTMRAAMQSLKEAGFERVSGLSIAH